jgi:peptidoglycan LD-endopeptidase CwlK
MTYALGSASRAKLNGVHPSLIAVVEKAIKITTQDFSVHDGLRTVAQQRALVDKGASKTMDSQHLKQATGYGHAVDLVPYINGQLRWEWKPIYHIISAVTEAANSLGVPLIWGGVWDRKLSQLGSSPAALEASVNAYVDRRRKLGKSAFIDGPHLQLDL